MSDIEVDQSGRVEMSGDTTVAASDGFTVTVRITAKVKREVRRALHNRGVKPKLVMIRMFIRVTRQQARADKTLTVEELLTVC